MARCGRKYNQALSNVQFRLIERIKVQCFKLHDQSHSLKFLFFGMSICLFFGTYYYFFIGSCCFDWTASMTFFTLSWTSCFVLMRDPCFAHMWLTYLKKDFFILDCWFSGNWLFEWTPQGSDKRAVCDRRAIGETTELDSSAVQINLHRMCLHT